MKEKNLLIKLIKCLVIIPLYYIAGTKSIFLYVMSLSLYNIFLSCFSQVSIKETITKYYYSYSKYKILKLVSLIIAVICGIFTIISILVSDIINITLLIKDSFIVFFMMGLSLICEPFTKLLLEYLESYNHKKLSKLLSKLYYILDGVLLIIISLLFLRLFKIPTNIAISLLYLSKIFSMIIIIIICYITLKKDNIEIIKKREETKINYKNEIKEILTKNNYKSIIDIAKNCFYYISIIILYLVLSTRYNYAIKEIEYLLTFLYFYSLTLINFMIDIVTTLIRYLTKDKSALNITYKTFSVMLNVAITFGMISPLIYKVIFGTTKGSIYLMMLNFIAIFIALYNVTFSYIKNKKLIYISLISGIFTKLIVTIPLINSFYRMGYNLAYGDIIGTIIGIFIIIIINYIYLKNKYYSEKYLEKILKSLYESIILCIILVLFQFIIPIKTDNYFKALALIVVYLSISIMFVKIKNKKRG